MSRPPFIVLDGLDGTGKSTQCRLLVDWLGATGVPAILCNDPGGTAVGDQLRSILLSSRAEISARTEALLFMASRAELVARTIRPALDAGKVVVCDRFVSANVVYQGHAGGLDPDNLWDIGRFSTGGLMPDLTIILDLPVETALERRGRAADRMESRGVEYMWKVRGGFLTEAAARPETFTVVDASPSLEEVQDELRQIVRTLMESDSSK